MVHHVGWNAFDGVGMIRYELECRGCQARSEGWYASSDAFLKVEAMGMVGPCDQCGSLDVGKALMAPSVQSTRPPAMSGQVAARESLRELRRKVERDFEHVGKGFAQEARRIHEGKSEQRQIYGEATPEERQELQDDNIPFNAIPWVDRHDG